MVLNSYRIIAIIGLISIILGNLMIYRRTLAKRRYVYPLLILGGICLEIYSIHIGDVIFIILQGVFIIASIYGLIRMNERYIKHVLKEI